MKLQNDLTTGDVKSHIIKFAIPLVISNLFQALYNAVDMFFVGRYTGTVGLSAVSVSGPIMNIMIMTISGLSIGVSLMIANFAGHEDFDNVKKTGGCAIGLYALISAVVTIAGFFLTPFLLKAVNTPAEAFPQGVSYLHTIFLGIVFMFGYNLIGAFQRGLGDSKSSMMFVVVACIVNIILDYLFICTFQMGAFGAALATVIAQAVSFFMGVAYFKINKHVITFQLSTIKIKSAYLKPLLHAGLPAAVQQLLLNISMVTLSGIANSFGLAASAAYGIGIKIDSFALLPSDAFNMSMVSFTSQNIGASKPERALSGLKNAIFLALSLAILVALAVGIFAPSLASIFNSDPEVIHYAAKYLRLTCFSYLVYATVHPVIGFIRGSGNSMRTLINVFFSQYLIRIPTALIASHFLGFQGIGVAVIAAPCFSLTMYSLFIVTGKWKRTKGYQELTGQKGN